MSRIVVSVRDAQLFLLLRHLLAQEGFEAVPAPCSSDVAASLSHDMVALLVDGSQDNGEAARMIAMVRSSRPNASVIMLRRGGALDPTLAAEFVLERPFEPARLLEFLRGLHPSGKDLKEIGCLAYADLTMDLSSLTVRRGKRRVHLTALQFRILRLLLQDPETVRERDAFIAACWPPDAEVEPRTVDIHIGHVRRALGACGGDLIRTIRGAGYALHTDRTMEVRCVD